jgi:hypothetical protein
VKKYFYISSIAFLLAKARIWFYRQEKICAKPDLTEINEYFEQIFDESSGAKAKIWKAVYLITLTLNYII